MTNSDINCEAFDAALPDYLEGALDDSLRSSMEMHLRECVRCASLLRDIENIQTEATALPDLVPSRDLWEGIEARIAAPVIPLAPRAERPRRLPPVLMGVAAAALVVSTAGITYMLTARSFGTRQSGSVALVTPTASATQSDAGSTSGSAGSLGSSPQPVETGNAANASQSGTSAPRGGIPATLVSQTDQSATPHSDAVYGKEIEMLQQIVSQRKSQLDPSTIAIIEKNLQIIDAAIAQSRAALARDPASRLLSEQLTHALDKKVELLRTAALLPAST
jgi:anti-sigma factor RsiW